MTVTYEVGHGGQMDIDFYVSRDSRCDELPSLFHLPRFP